MPEHWRDKKPIEGLPAGLISWFSPGDKPVVLVTFWVALIGGDLPRVRASWPGRRDPRSLFWPGGDFILHFLTDENLAEVGRLAGSGRLCFDAEADLGLVASPSAAVRAPLYRQFPMQLECCSGKIETDAQDPEIAGKVLRVHCATSEIDCAAEMDLHGLGLFRCFSSSGSPRK
ncbi:MAG TPA: hypothetical protein VJ910_02785 [Desulfuromonadales bacterium]|nr:hypothetical protein [Desulfuromonadales bacterium]